MGCSHSATSTRVYSGDRVKYGDFSFLQIVSAPHSPSMRERMGDAPLMPSKLKRDVFEAHYTIMETLGEGAYSVVKRVQCKATGKDFAAKLVCKSSLRDKDRQMIENEIQVFLALKHPNIVKFEEFYEDDGYYYIIMEYVQGGQLFDRIVEHIEAEGAYTEKEAKAIIRTLVKTVGYLHDQGIAHRDIKPENILVTSHEDDAALKLTDFGFAKQADPQLTNGFNTMRGTPGYVAPEILRGEGYGRKVDMWSIGVISYILLCGSPPFYDSNKPNLFVKIISNDYSFDSMYWDLVSDEAKDFVSKLLNADPARRMNHKQCLRHPWMKTESSYMEVTSSSSPKIVDSGSKVVLKEAVVERLKVFNTERRAMKKEVESTGRGDRRSKSSRKAAKSLTISIFKTNSFFGMSGPIGIEHAQFQSDVCLSCCKAEKSRPKLLPSTLLDARLSIGAFSELGARSGFDDEDTRILAA